MKASAKLDGNKYRVVVTNNGGSAKSAARTLMVLSKPKIVTAPITTKVTSGSSVSFKVEATGNKLKYQWEYKPLTSDVWAPLPGKTSATLSFKVKTAHYGNKYRIVVRNTVGSVTSKDAMLFVESTIADPHAVNTLMILNDWGISITDVQALDFEDGTTGLIANVVACYLGDETSAVPWLDLRVNYIGSDKLSYDNDGIYVDGDIWDTSAVYNGGCVKFYAIAIAPTWTVPGGVWSVEDTSDWGNIVEVFIKGL